MHRSFLKSLFVVFFCSFMPAHTYFESLSLWDWETAGKKSEVFIMGDQHVDDKHSEGSVRIQLDQEHYALLKNALHMWNVRSGVTFLLESNDWLVGYNNERMKKRASEAYIGMYFKLAPYMQQMHEQLQALALDKCDKRGPAFIQTKFACVSIELLCRDLKQTLQANSAALALLACLQENMRRREDEVESPKIRDLFDELKLGAQMIYDQYASEDTDLDEITRATLKSYYEEFHQELPKLYEVFKRSRQTASVYHSLNDYLIEAAQLDKHNQLDRQVAFFCIDALESHLSEFQEVFTKITNYIADAGFILALNHHRKTSDKFALLVGNRHADALNEYLKKYESKGEAQSQFNVGVSSAQLKGLKRYKLNLAPNITRLLFSIPFNEMFDRQKVRALTAQYQNHSTKESLELIKDLTHAFVCQAEGCIKVSIQERLNHCSRCKVAYYCSPSCQKKDWPQHKAQCGKPEARVIRL